MKVWFWDEDTGIVCGLEDNGELFLGTSETGYHLNDTLENRQLIVEDYCRQTGTPMPNLRTDGAPAGSCGCSGGLASHRDRDVRGKVYMCNDCIEVEINLAYQNFMRDYGDSK